MSTRTRQGFTQRESEDILRRAAELQRERGTAEASLSQLTADELEQIARDSGLDVEAVRTAIAERAPAPPASEDGSELLLQRTVPVALPDERVEAVVAEIERSLGGRGHVSTLGKRLHWTSAPVPGQLAASVVILRDETSTTFELRTRTDADRSWYSLPFIGFGVSFPAALVLYGQTGSALAAVAAVVSGTAVAFGIGHRIVSKLSRKRAVSGKLLLDRLADLTRLG